MFFCKSLMVEYGYVLSIVGLMGGFECGIINILSNDLGAESSLARGSKIKYRIWQSCWYYTDIDP